MSWPKAVLWVDVIELRFLWLKQATALADCSDLGSAIFHSGAELSHMVKHLKMENCCGKFRIAFFFLSFPLAWLSS